MAKEICMLCHDGDLKDLKRQGIAAEEKDIWGRTGVSGVATHPKESQRYAPPKYPPDTTAHVSKSSRGMTKSL